MGPTCQPLSSSSSLHAWSRASGGGRRLGRVRLGRENAGGEGAPRKGGCRRGGACLERPYAGGEVRASAREVAWGRGGRAGESRTGEVAGRCSEELAGRRIAKAGQAVETGQAARTERIVPPRGRCAAQESPLRRGRPRLQGRRTQLRLRNAFDAVARKKKE